MTFRRLFVLLLLGGAIAIAVFVGPGLFEPESYSNIHPEDYVGPEACVNCHEKNHQENFDDWEKHSHRVMNQHPTPESIKGDFSGARLDYLNRHAIFHRDGQLYLISIYEGDELIRRLQVTRTVGSLYVQYYIVRQIFGPEPKHHPTYRRENKSAFGWSTNLARWFPEPYLDSTMEPEETYFEGGHHEGYIFGAPTHPWNSSCLMCHNTYPYEQRLLTGGDWRAGYPPEMIDWRGGQEHGGDEEFKSSLRFPQGYELVTVGISCETCHFGGREHVVEEKAIRFVATSPKLTIHLPDSDRPLESDRDNPLVINSICAQCHTAELQRYPNGSPAVNSNEASALAGGACASAIKCTDCHSPHEHGPKSGAPDRESYIQACLNCHPHLKQPETRASHTRHSDRVSCLDCHMPRNVAGLDTTVRNHQISKPIDDTMLESASPNACNLCHLDRPITWTLAELEKGWRFEAPPKAQIESWYGDNLGRPVGAIWEDSESQFTRLAAMEGYARSPRVEDRIPHLMRGVNDVYPFNRTLALVTLERLIERHVSMDELDITQDAAAREKQIASLEEKLREEGH
jgi:hypothetical protein